MEKYTREQFIDTLNQHWGSYIFTFEQMTPEARQSFLAQQGYASLGALLGHIVAWWQDGSQVVARMLADPNVTNPDYDVDTFNAAAVRRFSGFSDAEMIQQYETQRQAMLDILSRLPDASLEDKRINERLFYEIIGHAKEHAFSA